MPSTSKTTIKKKTEDEIVGEGVVSETPVAAETSAAESVSEKKSSARVDFASEPASIESSMPPSQPAQAPRSYSPYSRMNEDMSHT